MIGLGLVLAVIPGKLEGVYREFGISCLCEGIHFMHFRDGRLLWYASEHPPATLVGRYEGSRHGSIHVYRAPFEEGEDEALMLKAYPRLLFTKFEHVPSGKIEWVLKSPLTTDLKRIIASQGIESTFVTDEGRLVKTLYDRQLKFLRYETK